MGDTLRSQKQRKPLPRWARVAGLIIAGILVVGLFRCGLLNVCPTKPRSIADIVTVAGMYLFGLFVGPGAFVFGLVSLPRSFMPNPKEDMRPSALGSLFFMAFGAFLTWVFFVRS